MRNATIRTVTTGKVAPGRRERHPTIYPDSSDTTSAGTGQVTKSEQDHAGTVSGSEPAIQYAFDADVTSSNIYSDALRLESTTYPNSRVLYRDYGGSGNSSSLNDRLGRLQRLRETNSSGTIHTEYQFNGTSRMVLTDYKQPNVRLDYIQGSSPYQGLDRFGRVTKHLWAGYSGTPPTTDRVNYTYDYAGNRLTRDVVGTTTHDQTYTYDGLHRLQSNNESGTAKDRYWQLDQLGNWDTLRKGLSPSSTLLESRSHNDANELTGFGTPSAAAIPDHDRAGNMTELVQPYKPADTSLALKYDAWNRLVKVESYYGTTLALNEYDGLNRRIVRDETGGSGVLTHFYYNQQWQVLEEHVGTSTTANKQFVYHPHYVDAIALRRDASGNDHYYLQDANFNVTAVTDNTGTVKERYAYTPYGEVTVLDADFSADSDNKSDISNEHLYTGRRRDPETGLQLNRNRFYAAGLGRWVNRDPIGYWGGLSYNLYEYVSGMPTFYEDPQGLFPYMPPAPPGGFPSMPDCPTKNPGNTVGDRWCSEGENSAHPGSTECFRQSFSTGPGSKSNQCCYDGGGILIQDGPGAGSPDTFGPALGEDECGNCSWGPNVVPHFFFEYIPYLIGF